MVDELVEIAMQSVSMENMFSLDFLESTNLVLQSILKDESSYSYDVYYSLLILSHNFRIGMDLSYLEQKGEYSYLKQKISSYYSVGGNREILPYLAGLNCNYEKDIQEAIKLSKQKFIVSTFYKGYQGLPDELKYFCELPDFYPTVSQQLKDKIYEKIK